MSHYRRLKLCGMEAPRATHPEFGYLQDRYFIPKAFCMPEELFREEQLDYGVLYSKRYCSVYDFYNMLSIDNPCYIDRRGRSNNAAHSGHTVPFQSIRQEPPAAQDNDSRSIPPVLHALAEHQDKERSYGTFPLAEKPRATSIHQAFRRTKNDPSYNPSKPQQRRINPSYNPFIHVGDQPARQDIISFRSTNPSNLDREQRESAEKAEVRRNAPRKNAPIPSDGDETNTDGESDLLFEDKLLPAQKHHIRTLEKAIRRIRSRLYEGKSSGYYSRGI